MPSGPLYLIRILVSAGHVLIVADPYAERIRLYCWL